MAADLRVGVSPASLTPTVVWQKLGVQWQKMGFRWGGAFRQGGPDLNHFDLGAAIGDIPPPVIIG